MKINLNITTQNQYKKQTRYKENITFKGLSTPAIKSMFVFDLDGALATASQKQFDFILSKAKETNSDIIYATGRTLKEFFHLQDKMFSANKVLPAPDYLIANNGQFLYKNIGGQLLEELDYQKLLINKSNYNREHVTEAMRKISQTDKYRYTPEQLATLKNLNEVKDSDPVFYNSKITYYEWNPSKNMAEYFLAHDVILKELKKELNQILLKKGIKVKFRENYYTKPIMDACNKSILLQSNSLRRHPDGSMTALFLCAADKADGIDYIRKKRGILNSEIIMAGNDDNDIPMAKFTQNGSKFICLADSSKKLIDYCKSMSGNIFLSVENGANGIIEGLKHFLKY